MCDMPQVMCHMSLLEFHNLAKEGEVQTWLFSTGRVKENNKTDSFCQTCLLLDKKSSSIQSGLYLFLYSLALNYQAVNGPLPSQISAYRKSLAIRTPWWMDYNQNNGQPNNLPVIESVAHAKNLQPQCLSVLHFTSLTTCNQCIDLSQYWFSYNWPLDGLSL